MRLIDADALVETVKHNWRMTFQSSLVSTAAKLAEADAMIRVLGAAVKAPTVHAAPVVHARWIEHPAYNYFGEYNGSTYECSVCHVCDFFDDTEGYNYCPNCGAKMDGGETDG